MRWLVALLTVTTLIEPVAGLTWLPTASGLLGAGAGTRRGAWRLVAVSPRAARHHPGRYPRGGSVHLRIWGCERLAETIGAVGMAGAPWIIYYAKALGAKIGCGVDLHSLPPVTGMVTLGGGCAIEPEVDLPGIA